MPGYEDAWYYLWKERCRLPTNVDPFKSNLEKIRKIAARLAKIFEQGLDKVIGYTLPLRREYYRPGRQSGMDERNVVFANRTDVSDSRRFADRISVADGFDSVGRQVGLSACL